MHTAINDCTLLLDEHLSTDVVYFDFSKALDSVPHTRLLLKLEAAYGITGKLLVWFKSMHLVDIVCYSYLVRTVFYHPSSIKHTNRIKAAKNQPFFLAQHIY